MSHNVIVMLSPFEALQYKAYPRRHEYRCGILSLVRIALALVGYLGPMGQIGTMLSPDLPRNNYSS